jgi:MerR family mercuric resistance operon transcriptional regulator
MRRQTEMAIGELSRGSGCNIETIRYYERIGLLPTPLRSAARYRLYRDADVERLIFVRRARELGFTLDEVRVLLGFAGGGLAVCAEVRDLAAGHLAEVRAKIADLRAMESALATAIRECDTGTLRRCALIEALSATSPIV